MRRSLAAAGLSVVLAALAPVLTGTTAPPPDATGMLAVLRRDGLILPFARVKGDDWKTPWPGTTRAGDLPINLASIPNGWWGGPPPSTWEAWLSDGTHQRLGVSAPQPYRSGCDTRMGLRSDYLTNQPSPEFPVEPFPKDGLAVSDGLPLEPIERVVPERAGGPRLLEILGPRLNKVEDDLLSRVRSASRWRHPVEPEARHETPVRFEAWYRAPNGSSGATASYVEIVRAYPPGPDDEGCGLETFFSGWVLDDPTGRREPEVDISAQATYCDRKNVLYMLPFGRLATGGRTFWAYQLSGWDEEWYVVTRVEEKRVRPAVEFFGGGATSCLVPRLP